jgi:hypothetical protein
MTNAVSRGWWATIAVIWITGARGVELADLPVRGTGEKPLVLLDLGSEPPSLAVKAAALQVHRGELIAHEGDASIRTDKDEIISRHPGFGAWRVAFRFELKTKPAPNQYTFWARWRQGGDPNVCVQTFEVWAGPSATRLEQRAAMRLKPKGWQYAWIAGEPLKLNADDRVVEVREHGAGHDAKVFDAFLLGPPAPPAELPISGTADQPVILLDLGKTGTPIATERNAAIRILSGALVAQQGADSTVTTKDDVQVLHKGFGAWGASFRFNLAPGITPGLYRFYARYKSGGEVSQVTQNFTVKAGTDPQSLGARGTFVLTNRTPWNYQWLNGQTTFAILPGDTALQVDNSGKADGAKIFDAFALKLETPIGSWMTLPGAAARNRFLALMKAVQTPDKRLYVLDGKGDKGDTLFRGLASDAARPWYDKLQASYLIGPDAEAMARQFNLTELPAAVMTDANHGVLGVLSKPKNEAAVAQFLANPIQAGNPATISEVKGPKASLLRNGVPEAWLVGGLQDGVSGVAVYGLDTESVMRPNPEQPYLSTQMMTGTIRRWQKAGTAPNAVAVIEARTQHSYGWSRGTGYAQLYLQVEQPTQALLRLRQSGIKTSGWLDGKPLAFASDPTPPADFPKPGERPRVPMQGLTTEGLEVTALPERSEPPQAARLDLSAGWHSLLVKLVMQHDKDESFFFAARFTDTAGKPLDAIRTQVSDPTADLALNALAARLRPLIYVDAPANLPRAGDPLTLRADIRWHPVSEERTLTTPIAAFHGKLRLRLVDYGGKELAVREITGRFPSEVKVDFGKTPDVGYYAVYPSLHTADGKLIMAYHADGFSVVRGNAMQQERLDRKKLWNNNYYALADGDKGFQQKGAYFDWLERTGIFKSLGSYPGSGPEFQAQWENARQRGIVLFADTSGDSSWLNDKPVDGQKFVDTVAAYTRFFKATNEIDIRGEKEWQGLRDPGHWVARARWEHEAVHRARRDGHYIGGSLVRPGDMGARPNYANGLGPGAWFTKVLELGLDKYHDAWDVHAYPQNPPRFGGPIGNSGSEDERGVLAAYAKLGRRNVLPFWLGETGAKAAHGYTGRRWQAEQAAKMIAWVNSRGDYLGLAFCIGHEYDWGYGRLWDYSMGHKPGEAALYTAGALIDGFPYRAADAQDANVQAAYFGETFMIWRTDNLDTDWRLQRDPSKAWVVVDVVGRVQLLKIGEDGAATVRISTSPVYVLSKPEYDRLTRSAPSSL